MPPNAEVSNQVLAAVLSANDLVTELSLQTQIATTALEPIATKVATMKSDNKVGAEYRARSYANLIQIFYNKFSKDIRIISDQLTPHWKTLENHLRSLTQSSPELAANTQFALQNLRVLRGAYEQVGLSGGSLRGWLVPDEEIERLESAVDHLLSSLDRGIATFERSLFR